MNQQPDGAIHLNIIYHEAIARLPDFVYLIDKNCTLITCNYHLLNFLNISAIDDHYPGALYKAMIESAQWTEQQVQDMRTKDIEALLSDNADIKKSTLQVIDKQESIHHYAVSRIPLLNEHHSAVALLVMIKDITEERHLSEQYEGIKAQLQQMNARSEPVINHEATPTTLTHPLTMLIVEDNIVAQKAAQQILLQMDCVVDIAATEVEMLAHFQPGKYDMVFMDIGFTDTSGYMLAKEIRSLEKDSEHHVPIIALTGYKAEMITADCAQYKLEGAITKPLTLEQARQLVQRYIFNLDIPVTGLNLASS